MPVQRLSLLLLLLLCVASPTLAAALASEPDTVNSSDSAAASVANTPPPPEGPKGVETKIIPLPVYATLPNEGATWGFMPVFMLYDHDSQRTKDIFAPSVSWNLIIHNTGTFRWYHYPSEDESFSFVMSGSTHVNWGGTTTWDVLPRDVGATTRQFYFRYGRNIFYRFFGMGPFTAEGDETSHTRLKGDLRYRVGKNIGPNWNVGIKVEAARDLVQAIGVPDLPLSTNAFPNAPGMGGSSIVSEGVDIRYDSRKDLDYADNGGYMDLAVAPVQGIASSPSYMDVSFEAKGLMKESDTIQGAARFYTSYVSSSRAPFYYQSELGGSYFMRGLQEDRYFDQGAWTVELEQRIRLFQTHIYGVTADWRVDPFFSVGQVFGEDGSILSNVKYAGGLGFRTWVRPNVLGRVDMGYAAEGLKFYVELGYPF
jgi:hypothetical protein